MDTQSAINVSHLYVQFGSSTILSDINVNIEKGKIICLLGPSGAGKTTLVKAIMGMCKFSGEISVFGQPIPSFAAMSQVGYMAQSDALYDDLSAFYNLLFFGSLFGINGAAAAKRAEELLSFVDLLKHKNKAVRYFSGGMKRRLSLAITLMHNPKLLILDEPTVGIDPLLRKKFWDEFARLKNEGCTIVVTTHVMDEANHSDEIMLLRGGKIIADDTLASILAKTGKSSMEDAFLYYSTKEEE